jgi:hypothetical protein
MRCANHGCEVGAWQACRIIMRRPTRTRRLSIAAIMSLRAFVVLTGAGVRSFWKWDIFGMYGSGAWQGIGIEKGRIAFMRIWGTALTNQSYPAGHFSGKENLGVPWGVCGFCVNKESSPPPPYPDAHTFVLAMPLWSLLLVMLLAPVCWLIAHPANAPAFPVITKQP